MFWLVRWRKIFGRSKTGDVRQNVLNVFPDENRARIHI